MIEWLIMAEQQEFGDVNSTTEQMRRDAERSLLHAAEDERFQVWLGLANVALARQCDCKGEESGNESDMAVKCKAALCHESEGWGGDLHGQEMEMQIHAPIWHFDRVNRVCFSRPLHVSHCFAMICG